MVALIMLVAGCGTSGPAEDQSAETTLTSEGDQNGDPSDSDGEEPEEVPGDAEIQDAEDGIEEETSETGASDGEVDESRDGDTDDDGEAVVVDSSRRGQPVTVVDHTGMAVQKVEATVAAGEILTFTFDVVAGQSVLVRQLGGCVLQNENIVIADVDGPRGIGGAIFLRNDCNESTRYDAEESGQATITISHRNPDFTGTFFFEVIDVTDHPVFTLSYGDRVDVDTPFVGAGVLEFPGSRDVYSFDVIEGDAYLIRQLDCTQNDTEIFAIRYEGVGRGSGSMQSGSFCDDSDRFEADETGTVLMYVNGGATHIGTGTYSFELIDLTATAAFPLQVGDQVSPGIPATGAGVIEEPGGQDVYTLDVVEGQTVVLTQLGGCSFENGNVLAMDIDGADSDAGVFFFHPGEGDNDCFDVQRFTVEEDGTITMRMSDSSNELTGEYSFEVGSGAETVEEAEEVLEELDAAEVNEERLITLDETVLFDFGESVLKANANQALADVADVLGVYIDGEVRIVGHTDSIGSDSANQTLSQRRAEAIEDALVELGVNLDRLTATGRGESSPVEPNENPDGSDNPTGRAANRRVEIFFSTDAP